MRLRREQLLIAVMLGLVTIIGSFVQWRYATSLGIVAINFVALGGLALISLWGGWVSVIIMLGLGSLLTLVAPISWPNLVFYGLIIISWWWAWGKKLPLHQELNSVQRARLGFLATGVQFIAGLILTAFTLPVAQFNRLWWLKFTQAGLVWLISAVVIGGGLILLNWWLEPRWHQNDPSEHIHGAVEAHFGPDEETKV